LLAHLYLKTPLVLVQIHLKAYGGGAGGAFDPPNSRGIKWRLWGGGGSRSGSQAEQELAAQATHPPQLHHKVMTVEMVLPLLETQETVEVVVVLLQMVGLQQRHLLLAMVEPD
jgi:hypothetical protein